MTFNPSAAAAAYSQLISSQSTSKGDSVTALPSTNTQDNSANTVRFLTPSGPLFPFHPTSEHMFRAMNHGLGHGIPFPMYPPLHSMDIKPEMMNGAASITGLFYDPNMSSYHPYMNSLDGSRRKNATRETTAHLKSWLNDHRKNPYPTKAEKIMLALLTKMTLTQVSTWFANARRRLKKENKMTWAPPNRTGGDDDEDDDDDDDDDDGDENDDDFAEMDVGDGDQCNRASSSGSENPNGNSSLKSGNSSRRESNSRENESERQKSQKKNEIPNKPLSAANLKNTQNQDTDDCTPPKKCKIWSIAETISSETSSVTKKKPSFSSSSLPVASENLVTQHAQPNHTVTGSFSFPNSAQFLNFNQWHQQMSMAMHRLPSTYHRSDIFAIMAQNAQLRPTLPPTAQPPHVLFNPVLYSPTTSVHNMSASHLPLHAPIMNGASNWCESLTSPISSTNSANDSNNSIKECDAKKS